MNTSKGKVVGGAPPAKDTQIWARMDDLPRASGPGSPLTSNGPAGRLEWPLPLPLPGPEVTAELYAGWND